LLKYINTLGLRISHSLWSIDYINTQKTDFQFKYFDFM